MANTRSAEKNIRKTAARTLANQSVKSRMRTLRKKVLTAIETGDAKVAAAALGEFTSAADKAAKVKVIHSKASDRLKSRMSAKVSAMAAK
jgi:small subunit ribosomal protein S20